MAEPGMQYVPLASRKSFKIHGLALILVLRTQKKTRYIISTNRPQN